MTTAKTPQTFRLPDPPEHPEDMMTNFDHLAKTSIIEPLAHYLGNRQTTLITGDRYLCRTVTRSLAGARYPDLLIAFNVDPEAHHRRNGYIIDEQGKPPDFVLEIASPRTGRVDVEDKPADYAALGIAEYWRFDGTGQHHRTRLAGDRLAADGQYRPIAIEEVTDGVLQGYSEVLNLLLRWENGQLRWHDPKTGRHIATFQEEREARIRAEEARLLAEARVRELEAKLESLENQ